MTPMRQEPIHYFPLIALAVLLALVAAIAYILIVLNVLGVGDLQPFEEPPAIIYIAASGYVLGGLLILARRRWLWIIGAVINGFVLLVFLQLYQDRPAVLWSPAAIVAKGAQTLLEISLIYLIVKDWQRSRQRVEW